MDSYDKTYMDIDELARKIEERIKELEKKDKEQKNKEEYSNEEVAQNIADLDEIISQIDERIKELESEDDFIDVDSITKKVNQKLAKLDEVNEDDLGKTIYDLSEICDAINKTIKTLEEKKKKRKEQKARYCDLARKKAYQENNKK